MNTTWLPSISSGSNMVCTRKLRSRLSKVSSRRWITLPICQRPGWTETCPLALRTLARWPEPVTPWRSWRRNTVMPSISNSADWPSKAAAASRAPPASCALSMATAKPGGVQPLQAGMAAAQGKAKPSLPMPNDMPAYMGSRQRMEIIACKLPSRDGASDSRNPVSTRVRSMAASSSRTRLAASAGRGDHQPLPEYQAIMVVVGSSASRPEGLATLRSSTRAHSTVAVEAGRVTSHSRSQSGRARSPVPSGTSTLTSHSRPSCNVRPASSAALNGPAISCAPTSCMPPWLPQAATASSWQYRLSTLLRAMEPKENSIGASSNTPMIQRPPRLPGEAARLLPLWRRLNSKLEPLRLSRRCRRRRISSQMACKAEGGAIMPAHPQCPPHR